MKVKALKLGVSRARVRVGSEPERWAPGNEWDQWWWRHVLDAARRISAVSLSTDQLSAQWPPMLISSPGARRGRYQKVDQDFRLNSGFFSVGCAKLLPLKERGKKASFKCKMGSTCGRNAERELGGVMLVNKNSDGGVDGRTSDGMVTYVPNGKAHTDSPVITHQAN